MSKYRKAFAAAVLAFATALAASPDDPLSPQSLGTAVAAAIAAFVVTWRIPNAPQV